MKSFLVVFNNNSGTKEAYSFKKIIYQKLSKAGVNFRFVFIDIIPIMRDLDKYDTIITVGGDGTINTFLPYLVNKNKTLGIIPIGTANLLAAKLKIPLNVSKALDVILEGNTKKIDTALINDKPFILRTGFGYDAKIINNTPRIWKRKMGYFAYVLNGFFQIFRLKQKRYVLKYEDKKLIVNATSLIVANAGNMYRNLVSVSHKSKIDDGRFDVFLLRSSNFFTFVIEFIKIILNIKITTKNVIYFKTDSIKIKTEETALHVDGEKTKSEENYLMKILPDSLNVYYKK
ncbi:YegS/Rv2252/BmrU family lipid kinase [bacterium]|nr:YegS/Rv2252/BmrU family lipid kinase [bacterium]